MSIYMDTDLSTHIQCTCQEIQLAQQGGATEATQEDVARGTAEEARNTAAVSIDAADGSLVTDEPNSFKCEVCSANFQSEGWLRRHCRGRGCGRSVQGQSQPAQGPGLPVQSLDESDSNSDDNEPAKLRDAMPKVTPGPPVCCPPSLHI